MKRLMDWEELMLEDIDGFKYLIPNNLWLMKHEGKIIKNDMTPPQKIREKELHFGMQDEEYLNSSKQNMCWTPCLFWSKLDGS